MAIKIPRKYVTLNVVLDPTFGAGVVPAPALGTAHGGDWRVDDSIEQETYRGVIEASVRIDGGALVFRLAGGTVIGYSQTRWLSFNYREEQVDEQGAAKKD
jgi:hypothetical protein